MSGFNIKDKTYLISGVANKKSVAYITALALQENGAKLIFTVQTEEHLAKIQKLFPNSPAIILDVENNNHLESLIHNIKQHTDQLDGFLHSMAFANFRADALKFHQTYLADFLQACHISAFSLVQISNKLLPVLKPTASIVTISISNTKATSYGYLGPIKAMLEANVCFLAKSLSEDSNIRVNSIGAGPLKTSASAGIPDYINNYLYAEELTLRKKSLATTEVANTALFLLSELSSGINAENIIVDCGMNSNYFDQTIVKKFNT
ncbi:MAG: SDR family oxidoreductase [Halobacteriovoraceae bacterium]|jgi:enoyl-[acyl-carrier protein] reductase I|nr:SDR family oxidoreductase [Halobacteriovoraceae bacterium]